MSKGQVDVCILIERKPVSDIEEIHYSTNVSLLGMLSLKAGRSIVWDGAKEVIVGDPARGGVIIGGGRPVVTQSMLTCDTMDTAECVKQTVELVEVGCQLVRITAPTVKDAANLQNIVTELRKRGQPPVVINRIARKVDWLLGLEAQRRTDPRAFPRPCGPP